jgi:hypothetical protein
MMLSGNHFNNNLKNSKSVLKHVKKSSSALVGTHSHLLVVGILLQTLFMKIVKLSLFGMLLLDLAKRLLHLEPAPSSHSSINFTKTTISVFKTLMKIVSRRNKRFLILKMNVLNLLNMVLTKQQSLKKEFLKLW